jgi:hypothetical protein
MAYHRLFGLVRSTSLGRMIVSPSPQISIGSCFGIYLLHMLGWFAASVFSKPRETLMILNDSFASLKLCSTKEGLAIQFAAYSLRWGSTNHLCSDSRVSDE